MVKQDAILSEISKRGTTAPISFFGPPPLIKGEDEAAYNDLLARVSGAVKPKDIFEEIWLRDIVDLTWEVIRWRRLKAQLIRANLHSGIEAVLVPMTDFIRAKALAECWMKRDPDSVQKVDKLLASADMTIDTAVAQTLSLKLNEIDRIDRMIMAAEARRNVASREIELHRAGLARKLREATQQIEDTEYADITECKVKDAA